MVAFKASLVAGYVKSPDLRNQAYLIFGSDAGLISERAAKLAAAIAERENPAGEIIRLSDIDLETDPARLSVELTTLPMFGGRKIVRATAGRRINALLVKPLIEVGALAGVLIVEAGNLKPDETLRSMFEKSPSAVALPCYADSDGDLAALIREVLSSSGQTIAPEAQQLLISRLGADRTLSRNEIEKLTLYAYGKPRIEIEDVEEIVGDAAEQAIDQILAAAASGNTKRAIVEYQRALAAGEDPQSIILAAQRYVHRLHRLRIALDDGRSFDDAVKVLRPALHFKLKPIVAAQLRQWTSARLAEAHSELAAAAKAARLTGVLDEPIGERMLMNLARRAGRSGITYS